MARSIEGMISLSVPDRAAAFVAMGMDAEAAQSCAAAVGLDMGRCILARYRSAVQPAMTEWGRQLE